MLIAHALVSFFYYITKQSERARLLVDLVVTQSNIRLSPVPSFYCASRIHFLAFLSLGVRKNVQERVFKQSLYICSL